jgi:hypothetical protein
LQTTGGHYADPEDAQGVANSIGHDSTYFGGTDIDGGYPVLFSTHVFLLTYFWDIGYNLAPHFAIPDVPLAAQVIDVIVDFAAIASAKLSEETMQQLTASHAWNWFLWSR